MSKFTKPPNDPRSPLPNENAVRVFYDVCADAVSVLAIVSKAKANEWLERYGESDEEGGIN